jgi:hypothetical protein
VTLQEEFSLESILSVITGIRCTNDLSELYELYSYMFEDDFIDESRLLQLRNSARKHILNIHPELNSIIFDINSNLDEWIFKQKELFGDSLPISLIGEPIIIFKKQPILR